MGKNDMAKFIINIEFQQNSTWQGVIKWVKTGKSQRFRSMMEMHRLMEEAMDNQTDFTSWE